MHRRHTSPRTRERSVEHRSLSTVEIAVLLALAAAILLAAASLVSREGRADYPVSTIRIKSAETLWEIADRHPIPGLSTQQTVDAIRDLNGMTDSLLAEGQLLRVPARAQTTSAMASR